VFDRMAFRTPLSGCGFYDIDGSELSANVILNDIPSRSMVVKGILLIHLFVIVLLLS
jgi:hypothetical protein